MLASSSSKLAARASRSLFTKASAMPSVGLTEEFPSVPKTQPKPLAAASLTTSTASSGLPLGSDDRAAPVATIGLQLSTGARDETDETAGVSQLFAKMAFRATQTRSDLRLYRDIEAIGGVVSTQADRDFVRYSVSVLPDQLEAAAQILAETTLAPKFALYDVDEQKKLVQAEMDKIAGNVTASLFEHVHAAAFYEDQTLGRAVADASNVGALGPDALWAFHEKYVNTSNAALVATGVAHSQLTELANEYFGSFAKGQKAVSAKAKYVGGESRIKQASKFTHVALALPTVGHDSVDFGASHVLRALLSLRLNNKKASAFLASYNDAAIFGLSGYAAHSEAGAMVDSFAAELKKVASVPASKEELAAAKTTAALEALEHYSTRAGGISLVGLLTISGSAPQPPSALAEDVTAAKLQELAQKALKATPSVAAIGKLSGVPHVDVVASKLQ